MYNLLSIFFSSPLFFILLIIIIIFNVRLYKKESKTLLLSFISLIGIIFLFSGKILSFINSIYFLITILIVTGFFIIRDAFNDKYEKVNITFFSILSFIFILSINEYLSISLLFEILWGLYYFGKKIILYYLNKKEDQKELKYILDNRHYNGPVIDEDYVEPKKENILSQVNTYLDGFVDAVTPIKKEINNDEIIPTQDEANINELYLEKELNDNSPTSYVEIDTIRDEFNNSELERTYEVKEEEKPHQEEIILSDDLDDLYELRRQILELKKNKA